MKKTAINLLFLAAAQLSFAAVGQTARDVTDDNIGQTIGVTCFGCHGYNGVSQGVAPSLRGRRDIAATLVEFKSGRRHGSIMDRIAKGYSDTEMDAVGRFFAEMGPEQ